MGYWVNDDGEVYDDATGKLVEINGLDIPPTAGELNAAEIWHRCEVPARLARALTIASPR